MSFLNILFNIFGLLIATVILIIIFFRQRYKYWKNRGVEHLKPTIPVGNADDRTIPSGELFANYYHTMKKKNLPYAGMYFFHLPVFIPIDLDLIKRIMQTDFVHFMDHGLYYHEEVDPLSAHVFALSGQKWRNLRTKLTPTFTSGKMKNMFPIVVKISQELVNAVTDECKTGPIETKDVAARFTTDIIGNCAFGIECNSLKDPNTEFRIQGKRLFALTQREILINLLTFIFPGFMRMCRVRFFPKEATDFFWNVIKETAEYREKNGVTRNDSMQLLLDMKNNLTLTFNELAAQAFVFFLAGFDTTSSSISFALLELALNEDVQNKLRSEINEVLKNYNGEYTYDMLAELHYLDMIIFETLRKYPPVPSLTRVCTKDYRVPGSDLVIPKGQRVFIPIQGIHNDPELYPNPHIFDPTRFNAENKNKRHPLAFLPFGEGPRACLGIRFAMMETKMCLLLMIRNFKLTINSRTRLPLKFDPSKFFPCPLSGLWIDLEKIV